MSARVQARFELDAERAMIIACRNVLNFRSTPNTTPTYVHSLTQLHSEQPPGNSSCLADNKTVLTKIWAENLHHDVAVSSSSKCIPQENVRGVPHRGNFSVVHKQKKRYAIF